MKELIYRDEAYVLVGLCMKVHRELGCGFLEAVYQEAFEILLKDAHIDHEREKRLPIRFMGKVLSKEYYADFICYGKILLEFKAVSELTAVHEAQVMNYLKAGGFKLGLLCNFGQTSFVYRRIAN